MNLLARINHDIPLKDNFLLSTRQQQDIIHLLASYQPDERASHDPFYSIEEVLFVWNHAPNKYKFEVYRETIDWILVSNFPGCYTPHLSTEILNPVIVFNPAIGYIWINREHAKVWGYPENDVELGIKMGCRYLAKLCRIWGFKMLGDENRKRPVWVPFYRACESFIAACREKYGWSNALDEPMLGMDESSSDIWPWMGKLIHHGANAKELMELDMSMLKSISEMLSKVLQMDRYNTGPLGHNSHIGKLNAEIMNMSFYLTARALKEQEQSTPLS